MFLKISLSLLLVVGLAGCATMSDMKDVEIENQALRSKVNHLQKTIKQKDSEIDELKDVLQKQQQAVEKVTVQKELDPDKATAEQIQRALKNAGFYKGFIDGKIGEQTKSALIEFQKAHNIKVDGIIGKETWAELYNYLQ